MGRKPHECFGVSADASRMKAFLNRFVGSDRGASMVEYGLMVALVAVLAVPAISMVGHETEDTFNTVAESLAAGDGGGSGDEASAPGDDGDSPAPGGDDDAPAPGDDDDSPAPGDDDDSPAPGDDDDSPAADPGSEAVVSSTNSSFDKWTKTKHGGEGAWRSVVEYQNDHKRHQYLTLEITRTDHKGKTTTSRVNGFEVPADGKATYELGDNNLKLHKGKTTGVVSVEVKVVSVTTADETGQSVTYPQDNNSTTVEAPKP